MSTSEKSLKGRLILDCSALLPGPFLGRLMAQKGARVIKIENPNRPDGAKKMGVAYADLNDCKEIVSLDLTDPKDHHRFHQLVQQADGLIEGFRPETKKKLGLDQATLHAINNKLCIVSLVGYPEDGPWRDKPGHDLNFAAVTGCLSLFNEMPALPLADLFCAYEGALALTAAMDGVTRGQPGRRVVVSMTEALTGVQSHLIREYEASGISPSHGETLYSGKFPCYRIYKDSTGRGITVGAIEHKFWIKVCEILNLPHLVSEGYAIGENGKQVIQEIQTAFSRKTWQEWSPLFEAANCCVEPVLNYSEVFQRGI